MKTRVISGLIMVPLLLLVYFGGLPLLLACLIIGFLGVKEFYDTAKKHPGVKPIFGCEVYVTRHFDHTLKDPQHKKYYHLILLAKNETGYHNLMKLVSLGHIEGYYYRPRIDHAMLEKYHEGLICSSACLAGEIPQDILGIDGTPEDAEKAIEWYKGIFGDDYYLEVMLHKCEVQGLPPKAQMEMESLYRRQKQYTDAIFELGAKHGVKVIATNDAHFVRKEDGPAHDRLICLTTNANVGDEDRLRYTQQEYLKSEDEMLALFPGHTEALANTIEILDKVEKIEIDRGHVLPRFELPEEFLKGIGSHLEKYREVIAEGEFEITKDHDGNIISKTDRGDDFKKSVAYLCELAYKGAEKRYGTPLDAKVAERLDFELKTISRMGFPDYFLIVQDSINSAKSHGVPG